MGMPGLHVAHQSEGTVKGDRFVKTLYPVSLHEWPFSAIPASIRIIPWFPWPCAIIRISGSKTHPCPEFHLWMDARYQRSRKTPSVDPSETPQSSALSRSQL